jgi:dihydroorotase
VTVHHLMINRNHILAGGIRPHYYCLPVAKRARHRDALRVAAASGQACFFHGSDSAPHLDALKLAPCGCAGCFTAHAALELYAEAFEAAGSLDRLEGFASFHGADFYRLPRNSGTVTLARGHTHRHTAFTTV